MFTSNPFVELSALVPPTVMQTYVVVMALLVVGGTLFDVMYKKSARYFFDNWRNSKNRAKRPVGRGELISVAVQTAVVDVMTSGEFCNVRRRIAHLLTMYGFVIYVITTAVMVFAYPTPATPTPSQLPTLWYVGALMVCLGGYWFWFFIRVDVAAEGNSPFRFVRADLFIVSLVLSVTFGLVWARVQTMGQRWVGVRVPGPLSHRHHGAVRINSVVQILSYVLQACCSPAEESGRSKRYKEQPARCRRRAPNLRERR